MGFCTPMIKGAKGGSNKFEHHIFRPTISPLTRHWVWGCGVVCRCSATLHLCNLRFESLLIWNLQFGLLFFPLSRPPVALLEAPEPCRASHCLPGVLIKIALGYVCLFSFNFRLFSTTFARVLLVRAVFFPSGTHFCKFLLFKSVQKYQRLVEARSGKGHAYEEQGQKATTSKQVIRDTKLNVDSATDLQQSPHSMSCQLPKPLNAQAPYPPCAFSHTL